MSVPQTDACSPRPISDNEFLEDITALLDNYRLSAEFRDHPYPSIWTVTDILKSFLLYSDGKIGTRTLMSEDLDELLLKSNKFPRISGFHDKGPAARMIRGLILLSKDISNECLLLALVGHLYGISCSTDCPAHMKDLILGEDASKTVTSMLTSENVILEHPYLDLISKVHINRDILLIGDDEKEMAECLSYLIDNVTSTGDSTADTESDLIIRAKYESSFPNKLERIVNNLPENRKIIVIDDCDLLTGNKKISQRSLDILRGKMTSLCRFISFFPDRCLSVAEITGKCFGMPTRFRVFNDNLVTETVNEEIDSENTSNDETVQIGLIATVRKGVSVCKNDLTTENVDGRAMYIRPKDVKNGELVLDNIRYLVDDDSYLVPAGCILVDSYPPFTRSYLVHEDDIPCVASPNYSIVIPNNDYLPGYVHAFFRSSMFLEDVRKKSSRGYITLDDLKSVRIPIASKDAQSQIIDRISTISDDPDGITAAFRNVLSCIAN